MLTLAGIIFLGLFVFGALFVSGIGPIIALALPQLLVRGRKTYGRTSVPYVEQNSRQPLSLSVLIPVFRDPQGLARTLRSIEKAREFPERAALKSIQIWVGIDGHCPECEQVAEAYGVNTCRASENQGKWRTLQRLLRYSESSDWIAFVDAGVEWSENLLVNCSQFLHLQDVMGIAPSYRITNSSLLNKLLWWIEASIKRGENFLGGPISVHGATVLYRRPELVKTLQELGNMSWINDDVVIPLVMRTIFPEGKIIYQGSMIVHDVDNNEETDSTRRRLRLALGNCQWIKWLYPKIWQRNRSIGILALRRIARVLWIWWFVFLLIGISIFTFHWGSDLNHYLIPLTSVLFVPAFIVISRLIPGISFITGVGAAIEASLRSPLYFITLERERRILWN